MLFTKKSTLAGDVKVRENPSFRDLSAKPRSGGLRATDAETGIAEIYCLYKYIYMTVSLSLFRFLRRDYSCAVASTEILLLSDVRRGCRYKIFFARENPLSRLRGEEPRKHRSPLCATARGKRVAAAETARVHRTLQRTGSARRGRHSPILDSYCECFIPRLYPRGHRRVAFCQRIIRAGFSFLRQMSNRT